MTMKSFQFMEPGRLVDRDLELVLTGRNPADPVKKYVPQYEFEMRRTGTTSRLGLIRLRIGSARRLRYPGQIGYEVDPPHRGHRYAARSCRLLLPFARAHGLSAVWLTVDPKNIASQQTCGLIGARYVETVRIPRDHEMYRQGARYRRRYRLNVRTALAQAAPVTAYRPASGTTPMTLGSPTSTLPSGTRWRIKNRLSSPK